MWMYDIAREQSPTIEHLRTMLDATSESGYNAIGLYFEHRFAYPSTPWSHGLGCVTPEMIRQLHQEYPSIEIIPFINLLGHCEGLFHTEEGWQFAEEKFAGMQACPSNPEFVELAERILDDALAIFPTELIHIGGDETLQLGKCPICNQRVKDMENADPAIDGKAVLYSDHFAPLAEKVVKAGRRPGVWGDMFASHPQALKGLPKETVIFDWQYFQSPEPTSRKFQDEGFDVVCCPTIHVYDAGWAHLPQSEQNVRDCIEAAVNLDATGVCVATWEAGLFGNYETLLPAIKASGLLIQEASGVEQGAAPVGLKTSARAELMPNEAALEIYNRIHDAPAFLKAYLKDGERYEEWARLMGIELNQLGDPFGFTGIRNGLKCRLMLYSNPFLAWLHHRDKLCGAVGNQAIEISDRALAFAPNASAMGSAQFVKSAVQFVQFAEEAHQAYARHAPGEAITHLSPCRQIFDDLSKVARATHLRIGGSLADIERCAVAKEHVERVIRRVKEYGDGSLGYLPSFAMLTHPKFIPHDQAGWWLMNDWANE
jgi:hypothetical protein